MLIPKIFITKGKLTKTINLKIPAQKIKSFARLQGFDDCGISSAYIENELKVFFNQWLKNGFNANMGFLEKNVDKRYCPEQILTGAKSVVVVILNYFNTKPNPNHLKIAKYAHLKDYHLVVKQKLNEICQKLEEEFQGFEYSIFCDTAPVFERYFAAQSGLGFIGKNRCLINKKFGSWVFIGGFITNAEIETDEKVLDSCKDCDICVRSCPTGALSDSGLDAKKCISYHTIENKTEIPIEIKMKMTNQVFGCDICQNVCPYNRNALETYLKEFELEIDLYNIDFESLENISNREFNRKFANTSFLRCGRKKLIANFEILNNNKQN